MEVLGVDKIILSQSLYFSNYYIALFQRIFVYDVAVKQLLGLYRFHNLLLIRYNHIKPNCAMNHKYVITETLHYIYSLHLKSM